MAIRDIIFHGKRLDNDEWVEGWYIHTKRHHCIITGCIDDGYVVYGHYASDVAMYDVDPSTVGQYTGLTDKNGKKIFEGDICRFREWSKGEMCWVGKVYWEHQQFMITGGPNKECETMFELRMSRFIPEDIEVIGNIHDNPELLEVENGI